MCTACDIGKLATDTLPPTQPHEAPGSLTHALLLPYEHERMIEPAPGPLRPLCSCHNIHVPREADVVFVEFTANDLALFFPPFLNNHRM